MFVITPYSRVGADVQKGKYWDTPLHAAAQQSSTEIVNLLLEFGADINAKNTELLRPIDVSISNSMVERILLQHEGKKDICEQKNICPKQMKLKDFLLPCKIIMAYNLEYFSWKWKYFQLIYKEDSMIILISFFHHIQMFTFLCLNILSLF